MKSNNPAKKYIGAAACALGVIILAIIAFFLIFRIDEIGATFNHMCSALMPFIIGMVLAYVICPLCNKLEKLYNRIFKRIKNEDKRNSIALSLSVFTGIIITILVICFIIMIIVPQLIASIIKLVQIMPDSADRFTVWLKKILAENQQLLQSFQGILDKVYSYVEHWISNDLLKYLENIAAGLTSSVYGLFIVIMNIFIGFIVAIYILLARKKLAKQSKMVLYSIFKPQTADSLMEEIKYTDKVFSGFINGKILDAVIVAIICYIGMLIFKLINPGSVTMSETLIAVVVGIFNIIPFFGWYIALIIAAILTLMVNPVQCIFFIIFDIILQQVDGNILGPKIIGNTTGISSFWVLFSILLFGDIWGFAGMLIGVPLFAVIYHLIKKLVFKKLKKHGKENMIEEYIEEFPSKYEDPLKDIYKKEENADEDNNAEVSD